MARINDRFVTVGESPYTWEREAVDFAFAELADRKDPFQGRALVDLIDPGRGTIHEIDLLLIGYSAIYLVEIKSHPGRIEGDEADWTWTAPDGRRNALRAPLSLINHKCKVLRSRLDRVLKGRAPWVQPLIFLSAPDVHIKLRGAGRIAVVSRSNFRDAIVHGKFPGNERLPKERISTPQMRALVSAFETLGLKARSGTHKVGQYVLGEHLGDGRSFQDYVATHDSMPEIKRRARIYRIPESSSEKQATCRRQAEREVKLLHEIGQFPNILNVHEYYTDERQGPTILFDEFADGESLDIFLHRHPKLSLDDRLAILEQISRSLAHCHRKEILHGGLAPESVLVRRTPAGQLETRLINFQLGASAAVSPTVHRTEILSSAGSVYQAPELSLDASSQGKHSDVFSLGALAFFLFTGVPPARDLEARDRILATLQHLDPWGISNEVPETIRGAIIEATELISLNRIDDVDVWYECLLAEYTKPERDREEFVSPLQAHANDRLEDGWLVLSVLGHGSSSRVIEVKRDDQHHALKVSLGPDHDDLLRAEGALLKGLRHSSIVPYRDTLIFGERTCLLLGLAGSETLQRHLSEHGPLDVDDAICYGEDLFGALDYLAKEHILHRDIKPGNLGIGARQKKARRLILFDFSLAEVALTNLKVGTDAYRDPYLEERGVWDPAADRWSAAITLHEALTGRRPGWGGIGQPLVAPDLKLVLAVERFDADARERLVEFFEQALAADVAQRFASAREMRNAWTAAFEAPRYRPMLGSDKRSTASPSAPPRPADHRPRDLTRISTESSLGELRLSVRATNALERAGISRMQELLDLPNNRLSAIRGIGRKVAREIFDFRESWLEQHRGSALHPPDAPPFFTGLRGEPLYVAGTGLPEKLVKALDGAGFETLQAVAAAPGIQIERLLVRAGVSTRVLLRLLKERADGEVVDELLSLEAYLDLFLPPSKTKKSEILRKLFGLDDPFRGRTDVRYREVANQANVSRQRVHQVLKLGESEWRKQAAVPALMRVAEQVLEELGGAAPIERSADALAQHLEHADAAATILRQRAAALWQILARLTALGDDPGGASFYIARPDGAIWIARDPTYVASIRQLGRLADSLAKRNPLAASGEVERALEQAAQGTPFAGLGRARLAELATEASKSAALSSRFEIYPRDMDPARIIDLSAQLLTSELSPAEVQSRARARFPAAAELPQGEVLHDLLSPLGLRWNPQNGRYTRARTNELPSTSVPRSSRAPTRMPDQQAARSDEAYEARDFEDQLRVLLLRGGLRALQLNADWTIRGSKALMQALRKQDPEATILHLDRRLLDRMEALLVEDEGDPEVLSEVDAEGPEGDDWPWLTDLAAKAADLLLAELLPASSPTLLLQPGLCARYNLRDFMRKLVEQATRSDSAAVILLVPSIDEAGSPAIRGSTRALPISGLLPGQYAWVPRSWILNKHRAAG